MDLSMLPAEWRAEIQSQIATYGLEAAKRINAQWAAANPNVPGASALLQWSGGQAPAQQNPAPTNQVANNQPANNTSAGGANQPVGGSAGGAANAAGNAGVTAQATLPTFAQVEQAFFDANKRWAQGDELNVWARANGMPQWTNSAPAPRPNAGANNAGAGAAGAGGAAAGAGTGNGSNGNAIVDTPQGTFRDLGNEAANTLAAQIGLAPQQFQAYASLLPQYSQLELTNLRNTLFGSVNADKFLAEHPEFQQGYNEAQARGENPQAWLDKAVGSSTYLDQGNIARGGGLFDINKALTTEANNQTIASNTALRQANMADASAMGGGALSLLKSLNPNQYGALDSLNASAGAGIQPSQYESRLAQTFNAGPSFERVGAGDSMLGMDLTKMAREQLALGGQASEWDLMQAEQAAREAWGARGLAYSPGAVGAEILNRDDVQRARLAERQAFAGGVEQLGLAQRGLVQQGQMANQSAGLEASRLNQSLGMSLLGSDLTRQQQNFGNRFSNAQLQSAAAFNPFATVTAWGTNNGGTNASMFNMGGGVTSGAAGNQGVQSMTNPFNGYASDLYNTNYNALNAARINAENVSAGKTAGWMNLAGDFLGMFNIGLGGKK